MYSTTRLNQVFEALSHPVRRQMVELLSGSPRPVMELARSFELTQPAVTQHLNVLEKAGLIERRRIGRLRECHLCGDALGDAGRWIDERRAFWEARLDRLEAVLAEGDAKARRGSGRSRSKSRSQANRR